MVNARRNGNLDMIISVGYRVKSQRGIHCIEAFFRL